MAVAHYGYLVMTMSSPNGIIQIRGDRTVGVFALEKLQALDTTREGAAGPGGQDPAPSSSRQRGSASAPHVHPLNNESVPVKTIQLGADAA
jgi:hypothetical protein